jgi:hypothetical protein
MTRPTPCHVRTTLLARIVAPIGVVAVSAALTALFVMALPGALP